MPRLGVRKIEIEMPRTHFLNTPDGSWGMVQVPPTVRVRLIPEYPQRQLGDGSSPVYQHAHHTFLNGRGAPFLCDVKNIVLPATHCRQDWNNLPTAEAVKKTPDRPQINADNADQNLKSLKKPRLPISLLIRVISVNLRLVFFFTASTVGGIQEFKTHRAELVLAIILAATALSGCGVRAGADDSPGTTAQTGSASSLTPEEKHRLYSAALAASDSPLDTDLFKEVCKELGIFDDNGNPNGSYMAFVQQHVQWGMRTETNQFRSEINTKEKAQEYVHKHLP